MQVTRREFLRYAFLGLGALALTPTQPDQELVRLKNLRLKSLLVEKGNTLEVGMTTTPGSSDRKGVEVRVAYECAGETRNIGSKAFAFPPDQNDRESYQSFSRTFSHENHPGKFEIIISESLAGSIPATGFDFNDPNLTAPAIVGVVRVEDKKRTWIWKSDKVFKNTDVNLASAFAQQVPDSNSFCEAKRNLNRQTVRSV